MAKPKKKPSVPKPAVGGPPAARPQTVAGGAQTAQLMEQAVDVVQSIELCQILACAVVSTVTSLRRILPSRCFKLVQFDTESTQYSYKDFLEAKDGNPRSVARLRSRHGPRFVPWDVLNRGTDARVNKLLDWIDRGVADALAQKYLSTMQLGVYDGEVATSKLIEAYVMDFQYTTKGVDMELRLNALSSQSKTLSATKNELRLLMYRLTLQIGSWPELPETATICMHLAYNETCPADYQPPGYVVSQDHDIILGKNKSGQIGSMSTGPHKVDVRIFRRPSEPKSASTQSTFAMLRRPAPAAVDPEGDSQMANSGPTARLREPSTQRKTIGEVLNDSQPTQSLLLLDASQITTQEASQMTTQKATQMSTQGSMNTQERMHLEAITAMARLRTTDDISSTQRTQVLASTPKTPTTQRQLLDIDMDLNEGVTRGEDSSTQGTPSYVARARTPHTQPDFLFTPGNREGEGSSTQGTPSYAAQTPRAEPALTPLPMADTESPLQARKRRGSDEAQKTPAAKYRKVVVPGSPFTMVTRRASRAGGGGVC